MCRHEDFMRRAVALSAEHSMNGAGGPFGAVVVRDGQIIGEGWNRVLETNDPTAHAEIIAIRDACARLGTYDLGGAVLYTSCEPCPMCLAAIYWARIGHIHYGNARQDAADIGFDDAVIYDEIPKSPTERQIPMTRLLPDEARAAFDAWAVLPGRILY